MINTLISRCFPLKSLSAVLFILNSMAEREAMPAALFAEQIA
jgi:hypothetical protein